MIQTLPHRCLAVLLLWAATALAQAPPKPVPQLTLLDGTTVPFQSLEIAAGKVTGGGIPAGLTLDDLRQIDLAVTPAAAAAPAVVVELRGGGLVMAKGVTIGDEKCRIEWNAGEPLSLPI